MRSPQPLKRVKGVATLASGAGMTIQAVTLDLIHCTVANNQFLSKGRAGQALSVEGSQGASGVPATANIRYTIISDHVNTTISDGNTSALTVYRKHSQSEHRHLLWQHQ
jgi:hypothetical protein